MPHRTIIHVECASQNFFVDSTNSEKPITRAPEGALTGALMCIALVGAIGWLAGIGVLAIPEIGNFISEGPGLAAICGIVVGATVGGLAGCLVGRKITGHRTPSPATEFRPRRSRSASSSLPPQQINSSIV